MKNNGYIDLGGGSVVIYWQNEHTNSWIMYSTLTEEAYESYEEFTPEIFFNNNKLNLWFANATKIDYEEARELYGKEKRK